MCGIGGFYKIQQENLNAEKSFSQLHAIKASLHHRGPDANGVWLSPSTRVGLAHTRLAIIDLDNRSTQPMTSASNKSVISFNGEIYNFEKIKSDMNFIPWRTKSDTEVLLEGLENYGIGFTQKIKGMFAFAYFDKSNAELTLAVDPLGKKPIYTYWDGKIFAFASEIKAFAAMGLPLDVCRDSLAEYFIYGSPFQEKTTFKNVSRLLGGYTQKITSAGPQNPQCYWDLPLGQIRNISYNQAKEELKPMLKRAVQRRLMADVPIGTFLSGGLDSSIVALETQRSHPGGMKTFSIGFPGETWFDETKYAETVAQRIGAEHRTLSGVIDTTKIDPLLAHFDHPFADSSALPTYILCKEVRKHATVALSGDGGDEVFGGYQRMQAALMSETYLGKALQWFLKPLNIKVASHRTLMGSLVRLRSAMSLPLTQRLLVWNSYFPESDIRKHYENAWIRIQEQIRRWEEDLQGLDVGQKILYFNIKTYLFDDLLPKVDRMSMANALEVRCPLLDQDLVDYSFTLPTHFKFSMTGRKIILKDLYRSELGSDIVDRRKHGFAAPLTNLTQSWTNQNQFELKNLSQYLGLNFDELLKQQLNSPRYEPCAFSIRSVTNTLLKKHDFSNPNPRKSHEISL